MMDAKEIDQFDDFVKWAQSPKMDLDTHGHEIDNGDFLFHSALTQFAWLGWKARSVKSFDS